MICFMLSLIIEKETQTLQVVPHTYKRKADEQRQANYHVLGD